MVGDDLFECLCLLGFFDMKDKAIRDRAKTQKRQQERTRRALYYVPDLEAAGIKLTKAQKTKIANIKKGFV